jgi:3-methyl-2-oxobutanoate hydroxymethyltransferase
VHTLGGYRIQGRDEAAANAIREHARALVDAGAEMLVLELLPAVLARELTNSLQVPVIGIGAGSGCSGQVLVLHDMLGLTRGKQPRFVRNFAETGLSVEGAVGLYVSEVKSGRFPDDALHGY